MFRFLKFPVLVLAGALLAMAQAQEMNVEQIAEFVRSELALKHDTDKQIGAYLLKNIHPTERLSDKTIEDLEQQGAGPKTVAALKQLQAQTAALKPPAHDPKYAPGTAPDTPAATTPASETLSIRQAIPPPDSVRQAEILDLIRQYALNYTQNLPNFVCVQVTRRYFEPLKGYGADNFHSLGDILAKVSYNEGQEHYDVYSVGGKYVQTSMAKLAISGGAISTGEFGSTMREVFEPSADADFKWDHWGKLRGRRMAVFHYYIDSGHSHLSIAASLDPHDEQRIYTAYEGLIYADETTGEITRIQTHAVNIPATFPVTDSLEILDYDRVEINGNNYMCPLLARLYMSSAQAKTKNEIEFRNYRRFGTEAVITFGGEAPAPLTPEQTEEQPVNGSKGDTKNLPKPVPASDPWSVPTLAPPPPK